MSVPPLNPPLTRALNLLRDIAAAFVLLTRIPVPWAKVSEAPPDMNASVWAFPVVGAAVGALGAVAFWVSTNLGLPDFVSAVLAIAAMVLMTGAFHEDGLADVADGFGGGHTVERKLEIMRDSRIGAYGMVAIVLIMALRMGGLASLNVAEVMSALIVAGMLSRVMVVCIMYTLPPARQDGLAHDTGKPDQSRVLAGAALSFAVAVFLLGFPVAIVASVGAVVAGVAMGWLAKRQIGGFTGDVLGAVQQLSEVTVLLVLIAYW